MNEASENPGQASFVVAIDGPSGVGKSTAARALARRLGVPYLDTGATYRAVGLAALERGVDPADRDEVVAMLPALDLELVADAAGRLEVRLDGAAVEGRIRTPEVAAAASAVAVHPEVRQRLVALQRRCAERYGGVLEGRDVGTRVFPSAPFKFYLDARPEVRIERRFRELQDAGNPIGLGEVAREVLLRDERDASRADSPLTCDETYLAIDASHLGPEAVVETMLAAIAAAGVISHSPG